MANNHMLYDVFHNEINSGDSVIYIKGSSIGKIIKICDVTHISAVSSIYQGRNNEDNLAEICNPTIKRTQNNYMPMLKINEDQIPEHVLTPITNIYNKNMQSRIPKSNLIVGKSYNDINGDYVYCGKYESTLTSFSRRIIKSKGHLFIKEDHFTGMLRFINDGRNVVDEYNNDNYKFMVSENFCIYFNIRDIFYKSLFPDLSIIEANETEYSIDQIISIMRLIEQVARICELQNMNHPHYRYPIYAGKFTLKDIYTFEIQPPEPTGCLI